MAPRIVVHPVDPPSARREAVAAADELRRALAAHGIVLPALDVDEVTYAHFAGRPLIDLGRIPNAIALALAAALNRRADT